MTKSKRSHLPKKDAMYAHKKNNLVYIINESYFYKTDPYYTIVRNEFEGIETVPGSSEVLDAYIVPICLEKARINGILVCDWTISHSYVALPAVVYGMNYFSTPSDHMVVRDLSSAKKAIKHLTNYGRYPFCYQKISETASVSTCVSILGQTGGCSREISALAEKVYKVFRMPLVEMVLVEDGGEHYLSALSPVRYSQLTDVETELLQRLMDERVSN